METCSRSRSGHRGVPGDPNVTCRKLPAKVRVEESGSEDEDEFKESREDIPPGDPVGPSFTQEQAPPLQSTSTHPGNRLGFGQGKQGRDSLRGFLIRKILLRMLSFIRTKQLTIRMHMKILLRMLSFIRTKQLTIRMHMKLHMLSKLSFKVSIVLKHR